MKFKDFQAPVLFSSTFKALNLGEKKFKYFQGFSRMRGNPAITLLSEKAKIALQHKNNAG